MSIGKKEEVANLAQTTLNGGINNSVTSLVVTSATHFPGDGNFRILVDSEIMLVTAVSGTTFTVTRGAEGTTAASHANLATVTCVTTAGQFDGLRASMVTCINAADVPASSQTSLCRVHFPKDGTLLWHDDTATIVPYSRLRKMKPPANASLTGRWTAATTLTAAGMWYMFCKNTTGGTVLQGYDKLIPSTPFSVITYSVLHHYSYSFQSSFPQCGVYFYESATGKIVSFFTVNGGGSDQLQVNYWNSQTSYNSSPWTFNQTDFPGGFPFWKKIRYDGTNLQFYASKDGVNWVLCYSAAKNAFFTTAPDYIGIGMNTDGSDISQPFVGLSTLTWEEGT